MSDTPNAVDGAIPAAPVAEPVQAVAQETPAPPATAEGQNEPDKQEQARDEKGRFVQERINELTKARRTAERERDELRQRLEAIEAQRTQSTPAPDKPPSFEDFTDLNQWAAAVAQHAQKQALAEAERKFSEQQQRQQQAQVFGTYEQREREYAAKNAGYAEALDALRSSVRFAQSTLEVIATSEAGPAVVHHLGEHLDVADRIARMPPHLQAAEIARLEARITAPKPKPVTQAPAPAPTVQGAAAVPKGLSDDLPIEEWVRRRREQLKQ